MDYVPRLSLRHLEVLREIGRSETWTEAADVLGMAQSSVSQAVDRVESMVGRPLFEASGVRRVPTVIGGQLIDLADRVLADVAATWESVGDRDRRGVLRVGVIDAVALYLFPDRLSGFAAARPDVAVRLTVDTSARLVQGLADRTLDVVVVTGRQSAFVADVVTEETLRVYGRHDGVAACVLYPDGSRTRDLIDDGLARLGIRADVVGTAPNPAVLRELARLGDVWTVLPEGVADDPGVAPLRPVGPVVATRPIVAVRRAIGADPLADAFVEALLSPGTPD